MLKLSARAPRIDALECDATLAGCRNHARVHHLGSTVPYVKLMVSSWGRATGEELASSGIAPFLTDATAAGAER